MKVKRDKNKYAYAEINKYYYKHNPLNVLVDIIAVPLVVPTFGLSMMLVRSPHQKSLYSSEICKTDNNCIGNSFKRKILLETNILCKNDQIDDNIVIVENLPKSITMDNYKVKIKKGKHNVENIEHQTRTTNGKSYQEFTIIPRKGAFAKNTKVWIIMDVTIEPSERDLIK